LFVTISLTLVASCKTGFAEQFAAEPFVQNERMERRRARFRNSIVSRKSLAPPNAGTGSALDEFPAPCGSAVAVAGML
jgi:hypothetical protein